MNKNLKIFAIGALYGLAARLLFGMSDLMRRGGLDAAARLPHAGESVAKVASGVMLAAFVVLVPLLIGVYTVYAARASSPSVSFVLFGPWVPTLCFVAGTAVLMIEGAICIAMALPIFCVLASLGGLIGLIVIRVIKPRPTTMGAVMLLPLLVGYFEAGVPLPRDASRSVASVHIAAKPEVVWGLINHAVDIRPAEMRDGLAWRIGVPYPVEAITQATPRGHVRKLRWAGNVAFDEPITDWQENRYIRWTYAFTPASFPPGTLDEHVLIGGNYFDLVDTSYALTPEAGGTRLDIVVDYRVSTHFNWYAGWLGRVMVDNAAGAILHFYKLRSES